MFANSIFIFTHYFLRGFTSKSLILLYISCLFKVFWILVSVTCSCMSIISIHLKISEQMSKLGSFCRYRKALFFWSLGISLYLELFCFLSFITIVLRNLCSGTHRKNPKLRFFLSQSHIGWDSGFSNQIRRIRERLGWLDIQRRTC